MLFCLFHRDKRVEKTILRHLSVSSSKNFLILDLPEPSTDCSLTPPAKLRGRKFEQGGRSYAGDSASRSLVLYSARPFYSTQSY